VGGAQTARDHAADVLAWFDQDDTFTFARRRDGRNDAAGRAAVDDDISPLLRRRRLSEQPEEDAEGKGAETADALAHEADLSRQTLRIVLETLHPLVAGGVRWDHALAHRQRPSWKRSDAFPPHPRDRGAGVPRAVFANRYGAAA